MATKEYRPLTQIQSDLAKAKTELKAVEAKIAGFESELQDLAQAAADAAQMILTHPHKTEDARV